MPDCASLPIRSCSTDVLPDCCTLGPVQEPAAPLVRSGFRKARMTDEDRVAQLRQQAIDATPGGSPRTVYHDPSFRVQKPAAAAPRIVLIDGYNVLMSHSDLSALVSRGHFDFARAELELWVVAWAAHYDVLVYLVFDAIGGRRQYASNPKPQHVQTVSSKVELIFVQHTDADTHIINIARALSKANTGNKVLVMSLDNAVLDGCHKAGARNLDIRTLADMCSAASASPRSPDKPPPMNLDGLPLSRKATPWQAPPPPKPVMPPPPAQLRRQPIAPDPLKVGLLRIISAADKLGAGLASVPSRIEGDVRPSPASLAPADVAGAPTEPAKPVRPNPLGLLGKQYKYSIEDLF